MSERVGRDEWGGMGMYGVGIFRRRIVVGTSGE